MVRLQLTTFDLLPELIVMLIIFGLAKNQDLVITVDADFKWKVWWN